VGQGGVMVIVRDFAGWVNRVKSGTASECAAGSPDCRCRHQQADGLARCLGLTGSEIVCIKEVVATSSTTR